MQYFMGVWHEPIVLHDFESTRLRLLFERNGESYTQKQMPRRIRDICTGGRMSLDCGIAHPTAMTTLRPAEIRTFATTQGAW